MIQTLMHELQTSRQEISALRREVAELRESEMLRQVDSTPTVEMKSAFTYKEAAEIWGVSYRTVQGWVAGRRVLTVDLGGPRIPRQEVERVQLKGIGPAGGSIGRRNDRATSKRR